MRHEDKMIVIVFHPARPIRPGLTWDPIEFYDSLGSLQFDLIRLRTATRMSSMHATHILHCMFACLRILLRPTRPAA